MTFSAGESQAVCEAGFMVRSALFLHDWAKEILSAVSNLK